MTCQEITLHIRNDKLDWQVKRDKVKSNKSRVTTQNWKIMTSQQWNVKIDMSGVAKKERHINLPGVTCPDVKSDMYKVTSQDRWVKSYKLKLTSQEWKVKIDKLRVTFEEGHV